MRTRFPPAGWLNLVIADAGRRCKWQRATTGYPEVGHDAVVHVHVLTGQDIGARDPDDLVVLSHRRPVGDLRGRDLVARWDLGGGRDTFPINARAIGNRPARDDHVVGGVEANG